MFPGCLNTVDGRLRVKTAVVPADAAWNHGFAFGPDFVYANFDSPVGYVNGLPYNPGKFLSMQNIGPVGFENGLPFTITGALAVIQEVPVKFVNGLPFKDSQIAIELVP